MWDRIGTLIEFLDKNVRSGLSLPSGLVLFHRFLRPNLAIFECHVPFFVNLFNHKHSGKVNGGELGSRMMH